MLRRSSILSVCFLLLVLLVQNVQAQTYILHIGADKPNGTVEGYNYYYDTLEDAWAKSSDNYEWRNGQFNMEFRLYADQTLENHSSETGFYQFSSSGVARQISITTSDGGNYSITANNTNPGTDFFSSISSGVHLNISSNVTITAGSVGAGTNNNATTIWAGSNLTANGTTFENGGPVVVWDWNNNTENYSERTIPFTAHSTVNLQGASFIGNGVNSGSSNASLAIYNPASVNLLDATFQDNSQWGAYIYVDDRMYSAAANVAVNLGSSDTGNSSVYSGNGAGAIRFGGTNSTKWNTVSTLKVNITGNLETLDTYGLYGEDGNYKLEITQSGGTWTLGEGTRNEFLAKGSGELANDGNRGTVLKIDGTLIMNKDSQFILQNDDTTGPRDQFIAGSNATIQLYGNSDPGSGTLGNYIEAYKFTMEDKTKFQISGDVISTHYDWQSGLNEAILTINSTQIDKPNTGNMIYFDIVDVRGSINSKVLITNLGDGTFQNADNQPSGSPQLGRTYIALIDGQDMATVNNRRTDAWISIANGGKDLVLNVSVNSTIVTAVPLSGATTLNWDLSTNVNWKYETQGAATINPNQYTPSVANYIYSSYTVNDAAVFNDLASRDYTYNVKDSGVYISQQVGFLQQLKQNANDPEIQYKTIEYGMRVSGTNSWTFNGGSINDDFDPQQRSHEEQINHVARLTFDGLGTLTFNNKDSNIYHDGTVIGNLGYHVDALAWSSVGSVDLATKTIMVVNGPGSLGTAEYAGEIAKVRDLNNTWSGQGSLVYGDYDQDYTVQGEGYGLIFTGFGGTIKMQNGSNFDPDEAENTLDHRIRVEQGNVYASFQDHVNGNPRTNVVTQGIITNTLTDAEGNPFEVIVTANDAYWEHHRWDDPMQSRFTETLVNNSPTGVELVSTLRAGGVVFVDPNAKFSMTGAFTFKDNRLLVNAGDTAPDDFDGGAIWAGYGTSLDLTGVSFSGNGGFYEKTAVYNPITDTMDYEYNLIADMNGVRTARYGGAIYFTGDVNTISGELPVLTVMSGQGGEALFENNIAMSGGAIYVKNGNQVTIKATGTSFTGNIAFGGTDGGLIPIAGDGGAIYIGDAGWDVNDVPNRYTLDGDSSQFINNIAYGFGGAIRAHDGATLNLNNATFSFNGADAIRDVDNNIIGIDTNNIRTLQAGAIYVGKGAEVHADGATFEYNAGKGNGGAIYIEGGSVSNGGIDEHNSLLSIEDARFTGNISEEGSGGAIYSVHTKLLGNGSHFTNNEATAAGQSGGALYVHSFADALEGADEFRLSFQGSSFSGNKADQDGGAIYIRESGFANRPVLLDITNYSYFGDNTTAQDTSKGGAIYGENYIHIEGFGAQFRRNMVGPDGNGQGLYGGAIYAENFAVLNFGSSIFDGNQVTAADSRGGAIYTLAGSEIILTDSQITQNSALGQGGAIYIAGQAVAEGRSVLTIDGTEFSQNQSTGAEGGAIYAAFTTITGSEATFTNNTANTHGGALYVFNNADDDKNNTTHTVTIVDSVFTGNTSQTGSGGAVYVDPAFQNVTLDLTDGRFIRNQANQDGGAIYAENYAKIIVDNAVFDTNTGSTVGGNRANAGSGGALYLDGFDAANPTLSTSELSAKNATFNYSYAAEQGGALYLRNAKADIAGARFNNNRAAEEGGAIYYENIDGSTLTLSSASFTENRGSVGGAVYTENETIIYSQNTTYRENVATNGDGGAIYFNKGHSELEVSGTTFIENTALGNGGAVRMQEESTLIASNATFNENQATTGGGGAIRMEEQANLQAGGAKFTLNAAAGDGGAVLIFDDRPAETVSADELNTVNLQGATFSNNWAGGSGGALYVSNASLVNVMNSEFRENRSVMNAGAIFVKDSDLDAKGSHFVGNTATAGEGGAVYYQTTTDEDRAIYLGTSNNGYSYITGNTANGSANSIFFDVTAGGAGTDVANITVSVDTEGNGWLNMADPMKVHNVNNDADFDFIKIGSGKWSLGGTNDFSYTKIGTTFDVKEGTFELLDGAELLLTNNDGNDSFRLYTGATFATAVGESRLETSRLLFETGSKMNLAGNLTLNVDPALPGGEYTIGSTLTGSGNLTKEDAKHLIFKGETINYKGNVSIEGGKFTVAKDTSVAGSGRFVTTGSFDMAQGTTLALHADPNNPSLVAKSANLDRVNLVVSGISGGYKNEFILIHTTDGISREFDSVNTDGEVVSAVDYLIFDLGYMHDDRDYGGTIGLRWYSDNSTLKAWGNFTLENEDDYFNVDVILHDNIYNLDASWNGKTLDKYGEGTLELSQANTYTGQTTIHDGELLLSNPQGTGLGKAKVVVEGDGRLGLDFKGTYSKDVTGNGQIVIRGGQVELSGTNTHSGGTVLKGGRLEAYSAANLGSGSLIFEGGRFRNLAEMTLNNNVQIADTKNAIFDVPLVGDSWTPSLTLNGYITGNGGLEKYGDGLLVLNAYNSYTGTTNVREGGLKIDGHVTSDVRVSTGAAVSGTGSIGDSLFISSGGYFDWFFSPDQSASGPLNVAGSVTLSNGAIFRPISDSTDFTESLEGWVVMTYGGSLGGTFLKIDNSYNPFYDFELDYSVDGQIRINGQLLANPRALSDIVTTGLSVANRKLYRNAFNQLMRETTYRKYSGHANSGAYRGQAPIAATRSMWFTPMARANKFASTYNGGKYDFESYGMQAGSTLWSNTNSSVGLMFGYERGHLRNRIDTMRTHDYYIGLYTGYINSSGYEFRGFVGGGFQQFTMFRSDLTNTYKAKYDGGSFEANVELARLFAGQNGTLFRPYVAADLEYASQESAQENEVGNAFRHYGRSDLGQFFLRVGADVEKRWQLVDINGGLSYACLVGGRTNAKGSVFYPVRGAGTTSYGARLGRSSMTFKTGLNWHLNPQRMNTIFVDYIADVYMDRAGDTAQHTGTVGFSLRF